MLRSAGLAALVAAALPEETLSEARDASLQYDNLKKVL